MSRVATGDTTGDAAGVPTGYAAGVATGDATGDAAGSRNGNDCNTPPVIRCMRDPHILKCRNAGLQLQWRKALLLCKAVEDWRAL